MEIIKLNLIPSGVNPICHAKQYDKGRTIRFELFNGLTPYTLQSGDTVTLNLRKPDNTIIESSVTATQGNKYVDLVTTEQICAVAGYNLGTFKIENGATEIGTLNFIMEVGKDVLANGIPSQSVIEDLDALVQEAVGDNYYTKTETDAALALKSDLSIAGAVVNVIGQDLKNTSLKKGSQVALTSTLTGKLIKANGDLLDTSTPYVVKKFAITKGHYYKIIAESINNYIPFAIYNTSDVCIFTAGSMHTSDLTRYYNDYVIFAPENASYILIQSRVDNCLFDLGNTDEFFNYPVDNVVKSFLNKNDFTKQTITVTSNKLINSSGAVVDFNDNKYKVSDLISINTKDYYYIQTSANYNNCAYVFYDSSQRVIGGVSPSSTSTVVAFNGVIQAPPTAQYIRLAIVSSSDDPEFYQLNEVTYRLSKWSNKKWVVVGDSLTQVNARATKRYYDYVSENTGINVVNMGISGSGYAKQQNENKAFYQTISNCPVDADVVTIFGSFNDLDSNLPLGTYTDNTSETIAGCINLTIDNLQSVIPLVNLGIVAPTPWNNTHPYVASNSKNYVDMLETICKYRSIPFLNLWERSNLRPWDNSFRAIAYSHDDGNGVHPDENGHKLIAPKFEGFLQTLLLS